MWNLPPEDGGLDLQGRQRQKNLINNQMDIVYENGKPKLEKRWVTEAHAAAFFCKCVPSCLTQRTNAGRRPSACCCVASSDDG